MTAIAKLLAILIGITVVPGLSNGQTAAIKQVPEPYIFTEVDVRGSFNGSNAQPGTTFLTGLNNLGQVVGSFNTSSLVFGNFGFIDTGGMFTGFQAGNAQTIPTAISDNGDVIGSFATDPFVPVNMFFYEAATGKVTTLTDLPVFISGQVKGINSQGVVVGTALELDSSPLINIGFIYKNGIYTTFHIPDSPNTFPTSINSKGDIAGVYHLNTVPDSEKSFINHNGNITTIAVPGANVTIASAMNDSNVVVGRYTATVETALVHAFSFHGGKYTTIDVPGAIFGTNPTAINKAGDIAGFFGNSTGGPGCLCIHGFVNHNGIITTIDVPGAIDTRLTALNDSGEIAGTYNDANGLSHGFTAVLASKTPGG